MRSTRPAWGLLFGLAVCAGCFNDPPDELAVWSEFLPYDEVQAQLDVLGSFSCELYLRVRPEDVGAGLWTLLRSTQAHGVPVRLWLQLPAEGTWLHERNVTEFAAHASSLLDQATENGIDVEWLIFDLEPEFAYAQALRSAAAAGQVQELLQLLSQHREPAHFEAALTELRALTDELHARHVRVMVATLPWTIDDLFDRDPDLQDALDTPLANVPWDQVCVMVYRPVFGELFGLPLAPQYVASYAQSMRAIFGPTAQVAIGNIGTPGLLVPPGYTEPTDIYDDVSAARSMGVKSISLFSLDGMVCEGGAAQWLRAASGQTPWVSALDPVTGVLRAALHWLDRLADGPKKLSQNRLGNRNVQARCRKQGRCSAVPLVLQPRPKGLERGRDPVARAGRSIDRLSPDDRAGRRQTSRRSAPRSVIETT